MVLTQVSESVGAPLILMWGSVFFAVGAVVLALNHWRFRTGWRMRKQYGDRPAVLGFATAQGYTVLPGALTSASLAAGLLIGKFATPTDSWVVGYSVVLVGLSALGGGIWMAKEWVRPTARRTPDWLK